jgi:hypothetical protein
MDLQEHLVWASQTMLHIWSCERVLPGGLVKIRGYSGMLSCNIRLEIQLPAHGIGEERTMGLCCVAGLTRTFASFACCL